MCIHGYVFLRPMNQNKQKKKREKGLSTVKKKIQNTHTSEFIKLMILTIFGNKIITTNGTKRILA